MPEDAAAPETSDEAVDTPVEMAPDKPFNHQSARTIAETVIAAALVVLVAGVCFLAGSSTRAPEPVADSFSDSMPAANPGVDEPPFGRPGPRPEFSVPNDAISEGFAEHMREVAGPSARVENFACGFESETRGAGACSATVYPAEGAPVEASCLVMLGGEGLNVSCDQDTSRFNKGYTAK